MQPAIDALTIRLQQRCNRHEPVVINTYQVPHHVTFEFDSVTPSWCLAGVDSRARQSGVARSAACCEKEQPATSGSCP